MKHLRASVYVLDVSPTIVHFSATFKKQFWEAFIDGKKPRAIISELGLDPDVLGDIRISGLKAMIRNEYKGGKGFRDLTTFSQAVNQFMPVESKIRYLEQQLAYKVEITASLSQCSGDHWSDVSEQNGPS